MKNNPLIHVGTFNKPHGLKGEIKIIMHLGDFKLFQSLSPFLIGDWPIYIIMVQLFSIVILALFIKIQDLFLIPKSSK